MSVYEYIDLVVILFLKRFKDWHYLVIFAFWALVLGAALYRCGYRPKWPRTFYKSVTTNFGFWWGNLVFAPCAYVLYKLVKILFEELNLPHLDESFWDGVPLVLLALMAAICGDFADYWNHRAMHHRWLWPIHAVHHSDAYLNPLTTYRVHFLEPFVMKVSYLLILSWLGFPETAFAIGALFFTLHNMYVHIMVDWDHGPFKYLLASPRMHQWHHADAPEAYGKNLANVFPFFDLMFGTYYVPGPCKERLGAPGVPANDFVKLSLFPFLEWGKALGQKLPLGRREAPKQLET